MKGLYRSAILVAMLSVAFTLGACGNKGALYLPEPPAEPQQAPSQQP